MKFKELKAANRKAFIPYITAGDPNLKTTVDLILALDKAGADVIEIGVPFSDPIADGPAIQRASERALAAGSNLGAALELIAFVRAEVAAPIVLFTYVNPVLRVGARLFVEKAAR